MKRALWPVACLCACAAVASASSTQINYQSFNPRTGNFDLTEPIGYSLPNPSQFGPGPYPVFLWLGGTFEFYEDPMAWFLLAEMNLRGFLAATVAYDNNEIFQSCNAWEPRAQGIFDSTRATSAVRTLCSLPAANCNPANKGGVVVMGASQGGLLAVLAKNYSSNVQAVYALSIGDFAPAVDEPLPCVDKANTAIPANRLTAIDGASDQFFYPPLPQLENITGLTCPAGSQQCWSPDGSGAGWYVVQNSQVEDGVAGHCYFIYDPNGNCIGIGDPGWLPFSTFNWSVDPNLDWLATFGKHRVFSPTGN